MTAYMTTMEGARARGSNLPISTKVAIEIANYLRGKTVERAITILGQVQQKTHAVPYKRFTDGVGHRTGIGAGRYPVKAAGEFLIVLNNAKSNAINAGMTGELVIEHIAANRASRPMRNRAKYRGEFKRTHLEVVLAQRAEKKTTKKSPAKKAAKEDTPKVEKKAEPKKEEAPAKESKKEDSPKKEESKEAPKKEAPAPKKEETPVKEEKKTAEAEK